MCVVCERVCLRLMRSYCSPLRTVLYFLCVNEKTELLVPNLCLLSATYAVLV